jgi:uncharacterized membrane protein YccC
VGDTHIFKSHHDEETAQLRTRIAELEAELQRCATTLGRALANKMMQQDRAIKAEAALAERDAMLRLFNELEYAARHAVYGDVDESATGWMRMKSVLGELADLRKRAEESQ